MNQQLSYRLSWGAEVANLADLVEPLLRLVEDVAVTGARTAQVMYNASATAVSTGGGPGSGAPWVLHHKSVFSLALAGEILKSVCVARTNGERPPPVRLLFFSVLCGYSDT
jgi:hypothetical protein